jgi:ureidoglycolate lyase
MPILRPEPLTKFAFEPFGEVVECEDVSPIEINQGFALRYNDLTRVDVGSEDGETNVSVFVGQPRPMPIAILLMERHPLGSQMFFPAQERPWLVLVCEDPLDLSSYRAFTATGRQGVTYARNAWHHPLLVLDPDSRFLIVDRKGPGNNLDEVWLPEGTDLTLQP